MKYFYKVFVFSFFLLFAYVHASVNSLNGQMGASQTFVNDDNFTITSNSDVHTLGWNGVLSVSRGGLGIDSSSFSTGSIPFFDGTNFMESSKLRWDDSSSLMHIRGSIELIPDAEFPALDRIIKVKDGASGTNLVLEAGNSTVSTMAGDLILRSGEGVNNTNVDGSIKLLSKGHVIIQGIDNSYGTGDIAIISSNLISNPLHSITGAAAPGIGISAGSSAVDSGSYSGGPVDIRSGSGTGNSNGGNITIGSGGGGENGKSGDIILETAGGNNSGDVVMNLNPGTSGYGHLKISQNGGMSYANLDFSVIDVDQTYTFPNATGTIPLLGLDQEFTGSNTFSGQTTFTNQVTNFISDPNSIVHIGADGFPGCIVMGDSDGSGVTYITADNGVLSASTSAPANCN